MASQVSAPCVFLDHEFELLVEQDLVGPLTHDEDGVDIPQANINIRQHDDVMNKWQPNRFRPYAMAWHGDRTPIAVHFFLDYHIHYPLFKAFQEAKDAGDSFLDFSIVEFNAALAGLRSKLPMTAFLAEFWENVPEWYKHSDWERCPDSFAVVTVELGFNQALLLAEPSVMWWDRNDPAFHVFEPAIDENDFAPNAISVQFTKEKKTLLKERGVMFVALDSTNALDLFMHAGELRYPSLEETLDVDDTRTLKEALRDLHLRDATEDLVAWLGFRPLNMVDKSKRRRLSR